MSHVEVLRGGGVESLLRCGAHPPFSPGAARAVYAGGGVPQRIHNDCSGKHAGMLALAVGMSCADHPVQERMLDEIARHGWPALRNTRGEVVGEIRPAFEFDPSGRLFAGTQTRER